MKTYPPNNKPAYVRHGFASIADRYDLLNDLMTLGMHRGWKRETIRRLDLSGEMCILDLCAGTGDLAFQIVKCQPKTFVVAVDFSREMMQRGKEKSRMANLIAWLEGDALTLPFPDQTFHGITVGFGLRNLSDLDAGLQEILRVLKPRGKLVSLDTAQAEYNIFQPFWRMYMHGWIPLLGKWMADSKEMYTYLTSSSEAFFQPRPLCDKMKQAGFSHTGYTYKPKGIGGAAIVWGQKP
ncbi:ubiquinone/menaquinone biosynthesis methyltransferase [bacterium]|nr:ubiquinone/menaquinone biosynthesis methyltransferase [bacterium]